MHILCVVVGFGAHTVPAAHPPALVLIAQDSAQPAHVSLFGKSLAEGSQLPVCPTDAVLDRRHDNEKVTPMLGLAQSPLAKSFVQSCCPLPQLLDPTKQASPGSLHVLPVSVPHVHAEHSGGPAGPVRSDSGTAPLSHGVAAGGAPRPCSSATEDQPGVVRFLKWRHPRNNFTVKSSRGAAFVLGFEGPKAMWRGGADCERLVTDISRPTLGLRTWTPLCSNRIRNVRA